MAAVCCREVEWWWVCVRSSPLTRSNLQKLAAGVDKSGGVTSGGYIYTSTDSGVTWTEQTDSGVRDWMSIASSDDGTVRQVRSRQPTRLSPFRTPCVAAVSRGGGYVCAFVASHPRLLARRPTQSNLQKLAAVVAQGYVYTSANSGVTWTNQTGSGSRLWRSIASSSNGTVRQVRMRQPAAAAVTPHPCVAAWSRVKYVGRSSPLNSRLLARRPTSILNLQKLAAAVGGEAGYIYTSTDSGVTWTQRTSGGEREWASIASSSDGTVRQVRMRQPANTAVTEHPYVLGVSRGGASAHSSTLSHAFPARRPTPIQSNLQKLAAVESNFLGGGAYIYTSTDSGATWTERASDTKRTWGSIASSSDGTVRQVRLGRGSQRGCHLAPMRARGGVCGFRRLSLTPSLLDGRPHPIQPTETRRRGRGSF